MIANQSRPCRQTVRNGAVAVEFAITVPILFLLFFAMIEFCRFNMIRHGIATAAYEGARRGIVPGATADDVKTTAETILQAVSTVDASISVDPDVITPETTTITVTIDVPLQHNGWVVPHFFKESTVTRSCTLAREQMENF